MTADEVRAIAMALEESEERETWGEVTFRVRDRIYCIMDPGGVSASIRTTTTEQADLIDSFPGIFGVASHVGRFGWVSVRLPEVDDGVLRGVLERAWERTRPKPSPPWALGRGRAMSVATGIPQRATAGGTDGTPGAARIRAAFSAAAGAGRAALIPYVVAGYPDAATSLEIAVAAIDAGADLLEIGLPYSDPLADGATLQRASSAALAAGMSLDGAVDLLGRIAAARPSTPLVPMCYANQLLAGGGGSTAARRLADAGASGVIVADLTPDEGDPFEVACVEAGLALVYLVAPTTPPDRRAAVAARAGGFLYTVSLVGVTGARESLPPEVGRYVRAVKAVSPVPVGVGFGVSRPVHVRALVRAGADGIIVASALVDALGPGGRNVGALARLVARLRGATGRT